MNTPEQHASASKWFRVAVEGATTDGRAIARDWITQMARNYSPSLYGARVNLEHIRGVLPDSPFNAYGDVLALEARDETGEFAGKLGLYARIMPTPALIAMARARQKIYTSIEVDPSFADTKQAYLVGLAVTDSPASLGSDMLAFSAAQIARGAASPLASRKLAPANLFSAALETAIGLDPPDAHRGSAATSDATATAGAAVPSLLARVTEALGFARRNAVSDDGRFADLTDAVEALAAHGRDQAAHVGALAGQLDALHAGFDALKKDCAASGTALADLTARLSRQPAAAPRPVSTGQHSGIRTDC